MNIAVVVVVHDRWENIRRWAHAWKQCDILEATLHIVYNECDGQDEEYWRAFCNSRRINFIKRSNIGYETGVIQDVIEGTIVGEWDVLFFVTDDTIPIRKNFLSRYIEELQKPNVGIVCMELCSNYTPHIRTTGWCIKKGVAKSLVFPASPVTKKEECYHFEHTGGKDTLLGQIITMELKAVQCSPLKESEVWDTHHNYRFDRWKEWHNEFPGYI